MNAFTTLLAAGYLLIVNALTWLLFAVDKYLARNGYWRISERTLLLCSAMGGSLGALAGRHVFRHKTRKQPFATILKGIAAVQLVGLVVAGVLLASA